MPPASVLFVPEDGFHKEAILVNYHGAVIVSGNRLCSSFSLVLKVPMEIQRLVPKILELPRTVKFTFDWCRLPICR